jgi:hypothetical protein
MQLTDDLVEAVCNTLDREAIERDLSRRANILTSARATLAHWREGRLTAEQAVAALTRIQSQGRAAASA